jgi:predicted naringenin-chalcone synthase
MTLHIRGLGTAVPEHVIRQDDAARLHASFTGLDAKRTRTLRALYRKAGVRQRHSVVLERSDGDLSARQSFFPPAGDAAYEGPCTHARMARYERDAPDLAVAAARQALERADIAPAALTHLVTVSCTGFFAPGVDASLIQGLGLPHGVQRTHVGFMGCQGTLNALRVASSLARTHPDARILVCSVELCSLHFSYGWNPDHLVANALFADGAGALVGTAERAVSDDALGQVQATGSFLFPDSADAMSWRIGNHGFRMTLSARVPALIHDHVFEWMTGWLAQRGLTPGDVGSWAVHPGGPRILDAFRDAAGLSEGEVSVPRGVLATHGNMSSATVLFVLKELQERGAPLPCVAVAFGPGLVVEATLIMEPGRSLP